MPTKRTNSVNVDYAEDDTSEVGTPPLSPSPPISAAPALNNTTSPAKSGTKRKAPKSPSTPTKKVRSGNASARTASGSPIGQDWSKVDGLTADKKAAIIDRLFTSGASWTVASLAQEFNVGKIAMRDAFSATRGGDFRDKMGKAAAAMK